MADPPEMQYFTDAPIAARIFEYTSLSNMACFIRSARDGPSGVSSARE